MSFLPKLPPEWTFDRFLDKVVCYLDQNHETFLRLKLHLEGFYVTSESLQDVTSADELFEMLKSRRLLTRYNLDFLHHILHEIGNADLLMQLMTSTKRFSTELGFQHVSEDVAGFEHIIVAIRGENMRTFDMAFLNHFKASFSSFMMVPFPKSFITGVEPEENCVKITFMIPEIYVQVLKRWMSVNSCDQVLKNLHVESIQLRDQVFSIKGQEDKFDEEERRLRAISALYENLQEREKDLSRAEEIIQEQIDQLGKIKCLPDRLLKLHTKSGMSVTLWKTLVKTGNGKLASHYIPEQDHIQLERQTLQCKIGRIYPHIKEPLCQIHKKGIKASKVPLTENK